MKENMQKSDEKNSLRDWYNVLYVKKLSPLGWLN